MVPLTITVQYTASSPRNAQLSQLDLVLKMDLKLKFNFGQNKLVFSFELSNILAWILNYSVSKTEQIFPFQQVFELGRIYMLGSR